MRVLYANGVPGSVAVGRVGGEYAVEGGKRSSRVVGGATLYTHTYPLPPACQTVLAREAPGRGRGGRPFCDLSTPPVPYGWCYRPHTAVRPPHRGDAEEGGLASLSRL